MIGIISYEAGGNIPAFCTVLESLGVQYLVSGSPKELESCDYYILPGVGAFDPAVKSLKRSGLFNFVGDQIRGCGKGVLGVCIGMHILCRGSEEGQESGLGVFDTVVSRFDSDRNIVVPHMGWNQVDFSPGLGFASADSKQGFYFLHGFRVGADCPGVVGTSDYSGKFASVLSNGISTGAQFHPEKSHSNGVEFIRSAIGLADA